MPYSAQYSAFLNDKHSFFSDVNTTESAENHAKAKNYSFLANNKLLIEQEFNQLFAVLRKQGEDRTEFWLYCYYCCAMLENYYISYRNNIKVEEYNKLKLQILARCQNDKFIEALGNTFSADLKELASTPLHISKLRDKIGFLNACRIYWTFCRLTITSAFQLARDSQWIDKLNKILGKQINVDQIIKILEAPNAVLRGLSVGFFVTRFIINAGMLLKHTFLPSEAEKHLGRIERFKSELWKRHPQFLNDVVWATVNGLTNYAQYFHIAAPIAGWTTAGFLAFVDISMFLWLRHIAQKDYQQKKSQYINDLHYYQEQLRASVNNPDEVLKFELHIEVIQEQLKELEIKWKAKSSTLLFNATGAFLLAAGFSLSMLLSPPIFVVAAYAMCTLGVAIYLSEAAFSNYREKSLRLEQAQLENTASAKDYADYQSARNEFIYTIIKNAVMPGIIITTFAICWQAALVLTAMYVTFELYSAYSKYREKNKLEDPAKQELVAESGEQDENSSLVIYNLVSF
ncbi:MAG: hypothetical protein Q8M03_04530 [Legionella sp.]|nr:hypothetical protein [Legionella sp.]